MIAQLSDYRPTKSASTNNKNTSSNESNIRSFEQKKTSDKFDQAKRQVSEAASKLGW
ncbi:hypothetical protein [Shewanella morhuae]|uniref:hypothetical protein n=1 Tax=Shewanella morhuae TaxID=365591 RepID=UPI001C7CD504|nr:hypothetical protein [Shewanella morhuae]